MAGYKSNYYGGYYGKNSRGSNYGYGSYSYGGSWNYWGSYYNDLEENDDHLIVKEPTNYTTPSTRDVELKSGYYKKSIIDQIKEMARVCYFKMIGDKDYLKEEYANPESLSEDNKQLLAQKKEVYDSIYENWIPGFTPLEQAIAIYKKLVQQASKHDGDPSEEQVDYDKNLTLDFDRKIYNDPTINEQLELNQTSKNRKMTILDKVSIIGDLGTQFKVEKEVAERIVSNSDLVAKKMMRDYSQMAQIDLYQKLFPNFQAKLLTKDLVVTVPVERKEQKQKIIIILDFSGSMRTEFKQDWVNAIMIDRLKYVLKGEAEVFFSYFVEDPNQMHFQHIHDRESVYRFWGSFSNHPDGGMTEVGHMVERISSEISQRKLMNLDIDLSEEKPEILVINDGQDDIDTDAFPYKVNAICLDETNPELRELCIATGGKQVDVSSNNKIVAYSESGEEKIN
jgi:hypothetical protein